MSDVQTAIAEILLYFHCRKCLEEGVPARLAVGWTLAGVQVWCEFHELNVIHLDFCGQKVKTLP